MQRTRTFSLPHTPPCACVLSREPLRSPPPAQRASTPCSEKRAETDERQRKTNRRRSSKRRRFLFFFFSSSLPTRRDGPPLRRGEAQGAQEAGQGAQEVRRVDAETGGRERERETKALRRRRRRRTTALSPRLLSVVEKKNSPSLLSFQKKIKIKKNKKK